MYLFIILLLVLFLIFISLFSFKNDNHNWDYLNREFLDNFVDSIFVDKNQLVYNKNEKTCYVSSIDYLKNNKVTGLSKFGKVEIYYDDIDGHSKLIAFNDKYYDIINIAVTNLPIVSVRSLDIPKYASFKFNGFVFNNIFRSNSENETVLASNVGVQILSNSNLNIKSIAQMSVRGASSQLFGKKAYKIKFPSDVQLLNNYKEDTWALDALFTDKSKIRNKFSSDIWDIINNNQKINNDLYGDYCELFVDDEYFGLYLLKNKVNKDITSVTDDGILIKSVALLREDYVENLLNNKYEVTNGFFLNYEIKKHSENGFSSIISMLKDYYTYYYGIVGYDIVYRNYDIDNFINYKIFVSLIGGSDNITYNQYISLSNSNSKILTTPWDMDLTWGLNWSDISQLHSEFYMESSYDTQWMDERIVMNMDEKTLSLMKERYWELRKNVITMDTINGYLNSYKELLVDSGAAKRDSERWYEYDVEFEIEQIREWAIRRIEFLDEYFK